MAIDQTEQALEAAFEQLHSGKGEAPAEPEAPEPEISDEELEAATTEPVEQAEPVEAKAEPVETEPEFEIEVDGSKEVVKGKDVIKELLQKGKHYSKGSEENARVREILESQHRHMQFVGKLQQEIGGDIQELRSIDAQLEQYSKIDWNAAIDADFTNAMKLQEQRNQLRALRDAKFSELNQKQAHFQQGQAQAAQQLAAAEQAALFAKAPELRNPEKWTKTQQDVVKALADYGFTQAEIGSLMDHRMLLVARDAAEMRALRASRQEGIKQVRQAPPVVKPGPAAADKSKTDARDSLKLIRQAGRKGDHKAQEKLAEQLFNKAFK